MTFPSERIAVSDVFDGRLAHTARNASAVDAPRHSAFVRATHWIQVLSFAVLLVSGITILLPHPRLYWGETGAVGALL